MTNVIIVVWKGGEIMTYMEFLEALVNAETEDERMELVKEHAQTFTPSEGGDEETQAAITAAVEEATAEMTETITSLKQEIKDRFFGKFKEGNDDEGEGERNPEPEDDEDGETKSLKDLGFGQKSY